MKINVISKFDGLLNKDTGKHNADGNEISPHLQWSAVKGAKTYALAMFDYDSTATLGFVLVHWVVANLKTTELLENESISNKFVTGDNFKSNQNLFWGKSLLPKAVQVDDGAFYVGPAPSDQDHYYTFQVWAIDKELDLKPGFKLADLRRAMRGHILGTATTEAKYFKNVDDYHQLEKNYKG